jgi:hypothetical protein
MALGCCSAARTADRGEKPRCSKELIENILRAEIGPQFQSNKIFLIQLTNATQSNEGEFSGVPVIYPKCHRHSRSTDLRHSHGESMKILEEMWMVKLEYPNQPITGSDSSMCSAIPDWTRVFESPFLFFYDQTT